MNDGSFEPTWFGASSAKLAKARSILAALGLISAAFASPSYALSMIDLLTAEYFGVLAGSTVTNTGSTVINGLLGVSPGTAITGFPPGTATAQHAADAVALQGQIDLSAAYLDALSRPTTVNLTGRNLGGLTLVPGVYNFDSSAQLTGKLTLNGLGNPNAVFIFKIGSTLTTASASVVSLINSAQGGNVFFIVGSSATLGTATSFIGNILAQTSITLNTGATLLCGRALARTGAVTLDTNTISICTVTTATGGTSVVFGPTGAPLFISLLPTLADDGQRAVANAIDTFVSNGGTITLDFLNLYNLSPAELASALSQLQGEAGTGIAQAGTQAMNSFLSLLTNPFNNNRSFALNRSPSENGRRMPLKALGYANEYPPSPPSLAFDHVDSIAFGGERRWSVWGGGYGGQNITTGDASAGTHDRTARVYGIAAGLDYRITPDTVAGFALAGGGTNFSLAGGYGSGNSDMFQAAIYSTTRINAAYISGALAYGWHHVNTDRYLTVAGTDHLTADFDASSFGGRIEGGYRFAVPTFFYATAFGITPYAAVQAQVFRTPSYSESAASGSSIFALAYASQSTTTRRIELGSWFDTSYILDNGSRLSLFGRAAWAHDWYSDPSVTATFLSLPGVSFTEFGAAPVRDSVLLTAGAQMFMGNGWSVMAKLDSELSRGSHTYIGIGRLRYTW